MDKTPTKKKQKGKEAILVCYGQLSKVGLYKRLSVLGGVRLEERGAKSERSLPQK